MSMWPHFYFCIHSKKDWPKRVSQNSQQRVKLHSKKLVLIAGVHLSVHFYTFLALYLMRTTPSVLKYKSFWHFTRFIEHSLNLDKLYVQIHWTFYESGYSKTLPEWLIFQDGRSTWLFKKHRALIYTSKSCNIDIEMLVVILSILRIY